MKGEIFLPSLMRISNSILSPASQKLHKPISLSVDPIRYDKQDSTNSIRQFEYLMLGSAALLLLWQIDNLKSNLHQVDFHDLVVENTFLRYGARNFYHSPSLACFYSGYILPFIFPLFSLMYQYDLSTIPGY